MNKLIILHKKALIYKFYIKQKIENWIRFLRINLAEAGDAFEEYTPSTDPANEQSASQLPADTPEVLNTRRDAQHIVTVGEYTVR